MSTRSNIGILLPDSKVRAVYCHYDGYPSGVGKVLQHHYTSRNKIDRLISLGALSFLGEKIGESNPFNKAVKEICCAYARDRGEELEILSFPSTQAFLEQKNLHIEWRYLWTGSEWKTSNGEGTSRPLEEWLLG